MRVRVGAAAVNYPDVLLVANQYQISVPTPFVVGSEFAGVIVEVADGAGDLAIGDRVTGTQMFGAFAEEVVVAAQALARIPDGVDDRTAAAFGVAHRTAYHALRSAARMRSGDAVIVLGAGGGVGLAAVQLAAALGADVTAVASSAEKLDAAASYGATHLINHRSGDLRAALRDALPDGATPSSTRSAAICPNPRFGRCVAAAGSSPSATPRVSSRASHSTLFWSRVCTCWDSSSRTSPPTSSPATRRNSAELLATGKVAPHIGAVYPLAETSRALRQVADGNAVGKVLIDLSAARSKRLQLAGMRSAATDGVAITPQRKVSVPVTEPASAAAVSA